jgi:integrase
MRGHIKKRSPTSWTVVLDAGRDPLSGKRRQLTRSLRGTKREAEALLVKLLREQDLGLSVPSGRTTVAEFLERWLNDYVAGGTAPKTSRTYEDIVRRHLIPALGRLRLTGLRPEHIQRHYAHCLRSGRLDGRGGLAAKSVLRHHQVLHAALHHAVKWRLLALNPADAVDRPRAERRELLALGPEDVAQLIAAAASTRHGALVRLAVMTGMRRGELLGLRWRDVDFRNSTLSVRQTAQWLTGRGVVFRPPKTAKSRRAIALSEDTRRSLQIHRQRQLQERLAAGPAYRDHDLVFATAIGTPVDPSNLARVWRLIVRAAGLRGVRFHDLRHAHATLLLGEGVHPKVVSERLGHASIAITLDTYSHVLPGLQADAASRMDELLRRAGTVGEQSVSK